MVRFAMTSFPWAAEGGRAVHVTSLSGIGFGGHARGRSGHIAPVSASQTRACGSSSGDRSSTEAAGRTCASARERLRVRRLQTAQPPGTLEGATARPKTDDDATKNLKSEARLSG